MKITGKQSQSGSILVFVTIACVAFIGFLGLAVDMGHLYMVKIKMQNAVDAAALAGAAKLPSESAAKQQAANFVQANAQVDARANGFYYDPSNATAAVTAFNDTRYPNAAYAITVTLTNNVPTYFLTVFGVRNFPLTVTAEAIASAGSGGSTGGPFDYDLFAAGSQKLMLNRPNDGIYHGSIYSGGTVDINGGGIEIDGNVIAKGSFTINGQPIQGNNLNGNTIKGNITQNSTQTFTMPDYKDAVKSVVNSDQNYSGNQELHSSYSGNIYVQGTLTIAMQQSGSSHTNLNGTGTVIIMADGDITINTANVYLGGESQVIFYSLTGNISFTGGGNYANPWPTGTVVAYAPQGIVYPGGGNTPFCSIVAQQISMPGGGNSYQHHQVNWPSSTPHVQLIH